MKSYGMHWVSGVWLVLVILFGTTLISASGARAQEEGPGRGAAPTAGSLATPTVANAVTPGRFIIERPTLISAGFEWMIEGDVNRNAKVEVSFRKKGETTWHPALPLLRLQGERIQEDLRPTRSKTLHPAVMDYTTPNAFAGSVLNLQQDTDYEFHFVLSDPDGVGCYGPLLFEGCKGDTEKFVTVHTRPEPMPAQCGNVYHVYPADWKGPKQEPSFTGLLAAYYMGAFDADFWNGYPVRVQPGDIILMHAGVYKDTAFNYYYGHTTPVKGVPLTAYGTFFDGTYYLHANGTPEKPIVIKAAGDGEVVIDGNNVAVLFDLTKQITTTSKASPCGTPRLPFYWVEKIIGAPTGSL